MSVHDQARGRFRVSVRALIIAIALLALILAPIHWMYRAAERAMTLARLERDRAVQAERQARAQQLQVQYAERIQAVQAALERGSKLEGADGSSVLPRQGEPAAEIERLKLENEQLKRKVDQLEEALEKIKCPPFTIQNE